MILIDYSGIAIAPVVMGAVKADDEDLIRHMILNTIRMYRQKFKQYGEVVVVGDAGGNWRKEVYPQYKIKRNKHREESKIDWDVAFKNINKVFDEITEYFPYKTIKQWGCEADDSIAEIVKWTQEFGNYEEVMIVSSDKDFKQLHKFPNVYQYSPIIKKLIKVDNPRLTQLEHFITGDAGDGVPNCLSPDNSFADGIKQNTLTAKKKAALMEDPRALGDEVYRNYLRNKKMIDLTETSECPENVKKDIINNFVSQDRTKNKSKVMNFFIKNQCRGLLEVIEEFI
jgi:membrane-associated HD superfamily phosphohydrolase